MTRQYANSREIEHAIAIQKTDASSVSSGKLEELTNQTFNKGHEIFLHEKLKKKKKHITARRFQRNF